MLCSRSVGGGSQATAFTERPEAVVLDDPFLRAVAAKIAEWPSAAGLAVAFSGGLDSTVLLTALARTAFRPKLRALHIDHCLHPDSHLWEAHCRATAERLGVRYSSERVAVRVRAGFGLESAAREARYKALAGVLATGEILLTAHHADDQLETVLLRLLRGSGVRGLRGIVAFAHFGHGFLGRPLLGFSKAELRDQAETWGLQWLEDPSNRDLGLDRNFLRVAVVPMIRERWPAASRMAERLVAQMVDAEEILEATAAYDARDLATLDRVPRAVLLALAPSRQRNMLRYLLREAGLGTVGAKRLEEIRASLATARHDAQTRIDLGAGDARIYRDTLYFVPRLPPASGPEYRAAVSRSSRWSGPEGAIAFEPTNGPGLPLEWLEAGLTLRFRAGGERFRPVGRASSMPLKHWFQESGILPWMRDRIPLLYRGDALVAVADLELDAATRLPTDAPGMRVIWTDHPPVR
jgi:tRNA(Ile)-lysidine synthase